MIMSEGLEITKRFPRGSLKIVEVTRVTGAEVIRCRTLPAAGINSSFPI